MIISIPAGATITNEYNMPMCGDEPLQVSAVLRCGMYQFTHNGQHYRVAESDATVVKHSWED
jgi:hypothetical protein